ncbi:hypothetical protein R3P38DRAFT_3133043 [Favolaschia claudopus]|uniref:Uncharacterized protein n=1 Tax=Favolaschia claudopus TaxID=2862362 RepID=A0AAV9Z896_9AGAR
MAKSISQGEDASFSFFSHDHSSIPDIHDMSSIPSEGRLEQYLAESDPSAFVHHETAPTSPSVKLASSGILPSRAVDSVEQLESRLTAQERGLVGVKIEVTALKGDVAELKEDVVGLKVDVVGLKEDVVGLKEDVVGLKEDVVGLKHDIATMRDEIMSMLTALVKK